jgi:hypothetical protein
MRFQQKVVLLGVQCLASSILAAAQITNCVTGTILCCGIVEPVRIIHFRAQALPVYRSISNLCPWPKKKTAHPGELFAVYFGTS